MLATASRVEVSGTRGFAFRGRSVVCVLTGLLFCLAAAPARAAIITAVPGVPDDFVAGDGNCTLREALTVANTNTDNVDCGRIGAFDSHFIFNTVSGNIFGDRVIVPAGTYTLDSMTLGPLVISSNIRLIGPFGTGQGSISDGPGDCDDAGVACIQAAAAAGAASSRVFNITGGTNYVSIEDVVIRHGNLPGPGTDDGGAIDHSAGSFSHLRILRTTLANNRANTDADDDGGALDVDDLGKVITIQDSTFDGNRSGEDGGAIKNDSDGSLWRIDRTTFSDNHTDEEEDGDGGAINTDQSNAFFSITNTTFSGNSADGFGGAINCGGTDTMELNHVTVTLNTADSDGGGGGEGGGISRLGSCTFRLANTIVAENMDPSSQPDCNGSFVSLGCNLIGNDGAGCAGLGNFDGNKIGGLGAQPVIDPQLAPLDDNGGPTETHALCTAAGVPDGSCGAASAALEMACDDRSLDEDQRQSLRPRLGNPPPPFTPDPDIGAYEADFCGDGFTAPNEDCDDGNTIDDGNCCTRTCQFAAASSACGDPTNNICTDPDTCDASGNCQDNNAADGTGCEGDADGFFCTEDTCSSGVCMASNRAFGTPCSDQGADGANPPCNLDDICDGSGTCIPNHANAATSCDNPATQCILEFCDGAGACNNPMNVANGTACNDSLFCNGADRCFNGACSVHTGDPCPDDNDGDCNDACNEAADNCTAQQPDGTQCTTSDCGGGPFQLACEGGACNDDGDGVPASEEQATGTPLFDLCFNGNSNATADWTDPSDTTVLGSGPQTLDTPNDCTNFITMPTEIVKESELPSQDPDFWYPVNLLAFETRCMTTAGNLPVKIFYHDGIASLDGAVVRKFNLNTGQYENVPGAMVGLNAVPTIMYNLPDNGTQDADPTLKDWKDPVGPAYPEPEPVPALSPLALGAALLVMLRVAFVTMRRRRW